MSLSKKNTYYFFFTLWLLVGAILLRKGVFIFSSIREGSLFINAPIWMDALSSFFGGVDNAILILLCLSVGMGYLKGKTAIKRSSERIHLRLQKASERIPLNQVLDKQFIALIAIMMSLSFALKSFNCPADLWAFIDVTVGVALLQGSSFFYREAKNLS